MKAHESTLVFWPRRGIYLLSNFGLFLPDRVINLFSSNLFISDFCLSGQRWIIRILLSLIRHMHILIFWIWLIIKCKIYRPMFIWRLPLRFFSAGRVWLSKIFCKQVPDFGQDFPFSPTWMDTLSSSDLHFRQTMRMQWIIVQTYYILRSGALLFLCP